MKKLVLILSCLPIFSFGQNGASQDAPKVNNYSKSYEMPYRTKSDVQKIGQNFLSENCMVGTIKNDDVVSHFSLPYKISTKSCLSVTVNGDVIIHSWDHKTGIEFVNLTYTLPTEGGSCSKTGDLDALYGCSTCRIGVADLKEKVNKYLGTLAAKYNVYVNKINGPDGYKLYAYDYGADTHFDYAKYYEQKESKGSVKKAMPAKNKKK